MHSLGIDRTSLTKLSSLSFAQLCTFFNCKFGQAKQWPQAAKKPVFHALVEKISQIILELARAYLAIR